MQDEFRVAWEPLSEFTKEVFVRVGMPLEDAKTVAAVLIWANLRGVDSHGVLRIPWWVEDVNNGMMNPKPNIQVVKETPATLVIEAERAFGPVVTDFAMNRVIEKAKEIGIGWAWIRNTTNQGAMGYYPLMAANRDMAGIALACGPPNVAPHGAKSAGISVSPITISVPAKNYRPLILDMALSVAAFGKLQVAIDKGVSIPQGWALDKDGNPTTDPSEAVALLPVGGPKGSGLSIMLECLASVMIGNPMLEPTLSRKESPAHRITAGNSVVAAINIRTFTDVECYKKHIDNLIDGLKALPTAEGFNEIFVPGELEDRTFDNRSREGIPLPEGTVRNLRSIARKFSIELPVGLRPKTS